MKKNYINIKKIVTLITIFISFLLIVHIIINTYNEKTYINLDNDEIYDLYNEYDQTVSNIINILNTLCIKSEGSCVLSDDYISHRYFLFYNELLLHISNIMNSDDILLIEKKSQIINYEKINFKTRILNSKTMLKTLYNNNYDHIINSYINSTIRLITLHSDEEYYITKKNNFFNINGTDAIFNDYKIVIENELESIKIIYAILEYIEMDLNN